MFKTISGSKLADRSKTFFSRLDSLARKAKLIVRFSPKFSAEGFTLGVFKAVLTGKASFNQLARSLGLSEDKTMTRQAVHQRVDKTAVAFMISATGQAIKDRWDDQSLIVTKRFNRVIIEDSSQAKTDKRNAEDFPGHGNGKGKTAGCKIDLSFDLLTGEPIMESLHLATAQDREIGKDLVDLVKGFDLVLRDMGYFGTAEFRRIESRDAFWLSRLPVSVKANDLDGRKLETILRTTKAKEIDCKMSIGDVCHLARLIAVRATPEVARERRRLRREQARQLGKQPNQDMLTRDGWHIIITNVGEELMKTSEIFSLYSVRWQIEIIFRAWKQSGQLVKALARRSNPFHLQTLMYGAILLLILTMKTASLLRKRHSRYELSIENIAQDLAAFILTMVSMDRFADYNPDPRHLKMDKRSRKSLHQTAVECLS
jgi:hypothetical protein